jgi:hypothetical protein
VIRQLRALLCHHTQHSFVFFDGSQIHQNKKIVLSTTSTNMPPKEASPLLSHDDRVVQKQFSLESENEASSNTISLKQKYFLLLVTAIGLAAALFLVFNKEDEDGSTLLRKPTGPYKLIELQEGEKFFSYYDFFDGPDSIGSAGYQTYVGEKRAVELGLANVTKEDSEEFIYLQSTPGKDGGFRESVRLEGKRRFERGLFVLDVAHMPAGCGIWYDYF